MFVEKGIVVEDGTHNQLMAMKGRFHEVITAGDSSGNGDGLVDNEATVIERHTATQKRFSKESINTEDDYIRKPLIDESESDASDGENIPYGKVFVRILELARSDWCSLFIASVSTLLIGISDPIFAILMAELFGVSVIAINNYG